MSTCMDFWIGIGGVVVGAAAAWAQQKSNEQDTQVRRSEEIARLARLEERLERAIEAGQQIQEDMQQLAEQLHKLEIQMSRLTGYISSEKRRDA